MQAPMQFEKVVQHQGYHKALKNQNKTFNQNEKNILLNRDNQILLNKLVDISQGKNGSVNGPAVYKQKRSSQSVGPRSLNISVRKRENDRIERENHAFAKRLFQNKGSIEKSKMDKQFAEQSALKNRIQRANKRLPGLNGARNTQLPPLDQSQFTQSRRSGFPTNQRSNSQAKFATSGMLGRQLNNDDSAGVIPINSMYEPGAEGETDGATMSAEFMTAPTADQPEPPKKQRPLVESESKKAQITSPKNGGTGSKKASKGEVKKPTGKGKLTITVKEAKLTRDTDIVGKQDPFVCLDLFTQFWSWKSKVIESGGKEPVWNEQVIVDVNTTKQKLQIRVKDEDLGDAEETIGSTEIDLEQLTSKKESDQWISLQFEGKDVGKVRFITAWADEGLAAATSPEKTSKKSPYLVKQKSKTSDTKLKGVPAENLPPADYKPEEDTEAEREKVAEDEKGETQEQGRDEKKPAETNEEQEDKE